MNFKNTSLSRRIAMKLLATLVFFASSQIIYAKKTNQAVYEEAFDQAAGGASLTRASQEGIIFANPALLPYGGKFHKWIGSETAIIVGAESVQFARESASNLGSAGSSSADSSTTTSSDTMSDTIDKIFETPIHFGVTQSISYLTNYFGLTTFARFEPDIEARKFGESGVPDIHVQAEAYAGAALAFAQRPFKFLSLGLTGKYLYVAEPDIAVDLTDETAINNFSSDPDAINQAASYGQGIGFDAGIMLHLQSTWLDYRLTAKVDDFGDTSFTGSQEAFKQTMHVGTAVTLHNTIDALHLCLDYRDIGKSYGEEVFKRVYAGTKLLIRNHIGLAAGVYQGYPTYGIRLDLFLLKLGLTSYGREFGDSPGANPRRMYVAYFAFGF